MMIAEYASLIAYRAARGCPEELLRTLVECAVLEERERCAKIAEESDWGDGGFDSAAFVLQQSIAQAIRQQPNP